LYLKFKYNSPSFVTNDGIKVITNDFMVRRSVLERSIRSTIAKWETATNWNGVRDSLNGITIVFEQNPIKFKGKNYSSFIIRDFCFIGWKSIFRNSSVEHELGHVIYNAWTKTKDIEACHNFVKESNKKNYFFIQ
jgi:hypothetical protein